MSKGEVFTRISLFFDFKLTQIIAGSVLFNHNGSLLFVSLGNIIYVYDINNILSKLNSNYIQKFQSSFPISKLSLFNSETHLLAENSINSLELSVFSLTSPKKTKSKSSFGPSHSLSLPNKVGSCVCLSIDDYLFICGVGVEVVLNSTLEEVSYQAIYFDGLAIMALIDPNQSDGIRLVIGSNSGTVSIVNIPGVLGENSVQTLPSPPPSQSSLPTS
ncbi:hypothetical protein GEMRC1_013648 [Eukaryota sp. GEM-RC1]